MPSAPTPVYFVYRRSSTYLGSTQMRGFQLCDTLNRHGSGRFVYRMKKIPNLRVDLARSLWVARQPRHAVYVFIKDAVARLHRDALEALQRKAGAVLLDHIDRSLDAMPRTGIDLHIASSHAQQRALEARLRDHPANVAPPRVGLILHQADTRLETMCHALPTDRLRPAYFGHPLNAFLPPCIAERVELVDVGQTAEMTERLSRFASANFHYAVRPSDQTEHPSVVKPLTKAVTAAVCGSPIMVNRTADDAIDLLGTDYPYLVDRLDPDAILSQLDTAAADFGGPRWQRALDRMQALAARVSAHPTARAFEAMLETVL